MRHQSSRAALTLSQSLYKRRVRVVSTNGLAGNFCSHELEVWRYTKLGHCATPFVVQVLVQKVKKLSAYTDPYFMLPAGIYDLKDAKDRIERGKVKNGIRLSDRYYIRRFPVWTTGRGNSSALLSKAIGLAAVV
jgi:hypothetical protein